MSIECVVSKYEIIFREVVFLVGTHVELYLSANTAIIYQTILLLSFYEVQKVSRGKGGLGDLQVCFF